MVAPKLRFKEFDGDWSPYVLKDFVSFRKGKGISKADISENGINECIRYGELYTTYGQVIDHIHSKTNVSKSECILSKTGDVIIPASGETQIDIATASCVLHDDIILSGDLNILSHEENGSWLAYYLSSAKKLEIAQLAQGNSVVHLYSSQLKDLKINKPSKEEQTKIASFLSNVDEKISQLTQKHELLSQYKQGMMQKLFSQQIRFKADDGSEFGEWEDKILKDLFPKIRNGFVGVATPYYVNYGVKYLQGKNIKNGKIDATGLIFINQEFHQKKTNSILKTNDILMVQSGHVGECAVVTEDYDNANCHALLVLSPKSSKLINSKFVVYYFYSEIGKKKIALIKTGNTIEHILASDIKEVALLFPCLAEQSKIANFLSAIDQKIEVVAQQIEQAKTWKKGLLQQMFV